MQFGMFFSNTVQVLSISDFQMFAMFPKSTEVTPVTFPSEASTKIKQQTLKILKHDSTKLLSVDNSIQTGEHAID